jgi:hypothetical protein
MLERGNRFLRILERPVILQPEDIVMTKPDPDCGVKGKRCSDYPCEEYDPTENVTFMGLSITSPGGGPCDSDGHYLCSDCVHLSDSSIARRTEDY